MFTDIHRNGKHARVRAEWAAAIADALIDGAGCESWGAGGRGTLDRFNYGSGWGLVRTYRRGGFIRHFLKETYLLDNRALRELEIHAWLQAEGLSVPQVLGACWTRLGPFFRGCIATQELQARNLYDFLRDPEAAHDWDDVARMSGDLFRQMHDLGVYHADLQLRNVLVGQGQVWLIDFDNARRQDALSPLDRARNLFRFRRSLEKNSVSLGCFQAICEGYGVDQLPEWVSRIYRAKGNVSDWMSR